MADKSNGKYAYSDRVKTPIFRGAFVRLFTPEEVRNETTGEASQVWSLMAINASSADISVVKQAVVDAARKLWGDKAPQMVKNPKFKSPLKDGGAMVDRDGNAYTGFTSGQQVFKLSTKRRPGVVDARVRPILDETGLTVVKKEPQVCEVIATNAVYSGCWFIASFSAQAYDRGDGFGVSLKLENIQLVKQDERLGGGGGASAENEFTTLEPAVSGNSGAATADDIFG